MNKPVFSRPPLLIGIGGTTRPGSSTERALAAALAHARTLGAQTQLFGGAELAALPPFNPEVTTRTPQEVAFVEAVRQADGILLASPGYHGGVSGLVKNAIDLLEDLRGDSRVYLDGRAVGCIVTAAGWQGCNTTLGAMRGIVHALRGWPTRWGDPQHRWRVAVRQRGPLHRRRGPARAGHRSRTGAGLHPDALLRRHANACAQFVA